MARKRSSSPDLKLDVEDVDLDRRWRLTVTPPKGSDLRVPDAESFAAHEGTPVVNRQELAWDEIAQMSKHLRRLVRATNNQAKYVEKIPDLQEDVQASKKSADRALQKVDILDTKVTTEMKGLDRRVEKVEERGHDCAQVAVIADLRDASLETRRKVETSVVEGIKTRERLNTAQDDLVAVDKEVKRFSNARRSFVMGLIGLIIFGLSSVGSLIWFLSALDTQVATEQRERRDSYARLEMQLGKMSKTANTAPVQREIRTLTKAVQKANGHETTEEFCSGLSDRTVKSIKRMVPESEWPRCRRFGLEPVRHRK